MEVNESIAGKVDAELEPLNYKDIPSEIDEEKDSSIARTNNEQKEEKGFSSITIEPVVFLAIFSYILANVTSQNLSIQKACRVDLNYSEDICNSLTKKNSSNASHIEQQVQELTAVMMSHRPILTATVPSIVALLVGSWSDRTGKRKVFMIIAITGYLLQATNSCLNVFFFHELNLKVLVISESIFEALSGGWCVLLVTCFSYISVVTTNKNRTYRMGLVNFSLTVAFPAGMGISGVVLKQLGYYGAYGISITACLLNLAYIIIFIKDPPQTKEQMEHPSGLKNCKTFFNLTIFKEIFVMVFKNGPKQRRLRLGVLLGVVAFLFGPLYGEMTVLYLSTRHRFQWDALKFSLFQTYVFVLHIIGTIFSILVLSKHLQWQDATLGIISTTSKIVAAFVYCFATNPFIFAVVAPVVEILNSTSFLAMRSTISKLVTPNELGKVNATFGLVENLSPLMFVPLYCRVYVATMSMLPGAIFLMSAGLTLPGLGVFLWLFLEHRKRDNVTRKDITI